MSETQRLARLGYLGTVISKMTGVLESTLNPYIKDIPPIRKFPNSPDLTRSLSLSRIEGSLAIA